MKCADPKYELPDLRVGRRIHFMYGNVQWMGIVLCHGHSGERGYVINAVRYDMLPVDSSSDLSEIFRNILTVPNNWFREHAENVLAVYEEPESKGRILLPWYWGERLYARPIKRRMTVKQICEELGYDVEIVKEEE